MEEESMQAHIQTAAISKKRLYRCLHSV